MTQKTVYKTLSLLFILISSFFTHGTEAAEHPSTESISQNSPLSLPTKPFYIIRHGETDWNKKGLIQGQKDIPLNETGEMQAKEAALALKDKNIKKIYASPLKRADETAAIIRETLRSIKKPITVDDDLKERNMGKLEGHSSHETEYSGGELTDDPSLNGESHETFKDRAIRGITDCVSKKNEGNILIVTHGGVIAVFMEAIGFKNHFIKNATPFYITPPKPGQNKWSVEEISVSSNPLSEEEN